jgi:hypothetical protein
MLLVHSKALPGFFLCIFSSYFQQAGSSAVEGTSQAVLGSSGQWKVPASLSLGLRREKIPALLYIGKGHEDRPFCDFRPQGLVLEPFSNTKELKIDLGEQTGSPKRRRLKERKKNEVPSIMIGGTITGWPGVPQDLW